VTYRQPARTVRIRWGRVAGLLVVCTAIVAALGSQWPAASFSTAPPTVPTFTAVPSPKDPGVANLDADLRKALRRAMNRAAGDGIVLLVDSGWRSPEHQQQLLDEAIIKYGSQAEAARWVATPNRSAHVVGDAVDIGPTEATRWLSANGARYGLCQIYGNEPWHYELRPDAREQGCPPMYADPTHDPRMQQ
jgi:zinc D-Ala-D-Ala carboxypeptidase